MIPGLAVERTHLAWIRTATTLAAAGLLAGGAALRHGISGVAAGAFVLASLCGAILLARTRSRYARTGHDLDVLIAWAGVLCAVTGAVVFVLTS